MHKTVTSQTTIHKYYCDRCNKELEPDRSHDETISDLMEECVLCEKEICYDCAVNIPSIDSSNSRDWLCSDCATKCKETLDKMRENIRSSYATHKILMHELYGHKTLK
jgi:DNA-directed RNA polymerase subunit RPC12/RpoP